MGAIGGGIWHGIKGARNSPRGERLIGSVSAIKARAPVLGGNFGVWGGLFSSFDCAVKGYRQKEDPWNAITAGFLTGGSLAFRCESRFIHDCCNEGERREGRQGCSRGRKNLDDNETEADCHLAGPRSALGSAIGCGILLGVFEGMLHHQQDMERRS
jgi:import inner membrane translocase subunit TIM17